MIVLPELQYEYSALEPHIDGKTMEIHHTKHHQAYIDNLLKALKDVDKDRKPEDYGDECIKKLLSGLESSDLEDGLKTQIRNNGGGHLNHSMFWKLIGPGKGGEPQGKVLDAINKSFGSFEKFKEEFASAATKRFGSGWAWLIKKEDGLLEIISTANQDSPLMDGKNPILGLDVWEHAYYLKYQNRRPDYVEAFWNVVNWDEVEKLYEA